MSNRPPPRGTAGMPRPRPVYRFRQGVRRNPPDYKDPDTPPESVVDDEEEFIIYEDEPSPQLILPTITSPAPFKSQPILKEMASTIYRYLHIDSADRNPHELTSRMDIHLNSHPIKNVKRVGVMKATITNTGHNIHDNHDQLLIGVKLSGSATPFAIEIDLDHRYAIITDIVNDINTKIQAYTNAGNTLLQSAVRALTFTANNNKIEITAGVLATQTAFYAPLVRLGMNPNTLWYELGFASVQQVLTIQVWENVVVPDLVVNGDASQYVKQTAISTARVIKNNTYPLKGFYVIQIENPKGFYIASKTLTSGGNVFRTRINGNTAQVDFDEHLIYIPNKASRDEYNHYETNVIEWHELHGDIQNFDVELRNHADKVFSADAERLESSGDGSAIPPYMMTLVFECVNPNVYQPTHTQAYQSEAWYEAHRQN